MPLRWVIILDAGLGTLLELRQQVLGGHKIEMAAACVLEERDVLVAGPAGHGAGGELVVVADYVLDADYPSVEGDCDLAGIDGGLARVHVDPGSADRLVVGLAHVGR